MMGGRMIEDVDEKIQELDLFQKSIFMFLDI
jgi:hypothetical protein